MGDQDCRSGLEYIKVQNKRLIFECLRCNKSHKNISKRTLQKDLITHITFVMETLRKGVYPYEYMDSWERLRKTILPT